MTGPLHSPSPLNSCLFHTALTRPTGMLLYLVVSAKTGMAFCILIERALGQENVCT